MHVQPGNAPQPALSFSTRARELSPPSIKTANGLTPWLVDRVVGADHVHVDDADHGARAETLTGSHELLAAEETLLLASEQRKKDVGGRSSRSQDVRQLEQACAAGAIVVGARALDPGPPAWLMLSRWPVTSTRGGVLEPGNRRDQICGHALARDGYRLVRDLVAARAQNARTVIDRLAKTVRRRKPRAEARQCREVLEQATYRD